jgi:hypothetical protein
VLDQFAPPILLGNQPDASSFSTAQVQALASLRGHLSHVDYTLYTVFIGLDILCLSYGQGTAIGPARLPRSLRYKIILLPYGGAPRQDPRHDDQREKDEHAGLPSRVRGSLRVSNDCHRPCRKPTSAAASRG